MSNLLASDFSSFLEIQKPRCGLCCNATSIMLIYSLLLICFFLPNATAKITQEFIFENPPFASCHASSITETSSGKLLCAYFAGTEEGANDVGIWLSVHSEKGWEAPRLIAKDCEVPCWNPVLFTTPSGEILLFYKVGPRPTSWSGIIKRSYDEGNQWTQEELLPAGILGPSKNKPLLLKNGDLLCGSSTETWRRWGCWIDITKDFGRTWEKSSPINLKGSVFGMIQPTLFLGKEDEIHLLARTLSMGAICSSRSKDYGKSWTEAVPIKLKNPNSAIDTVRLDSGQIIIVFNNSTEERSPLCVATSYDDGLNWEVSLILEGSRGEYSYPSIIQARNGQIHITYTYNRKQIKHVAIDPIHLIRPSKDK